MSKYRVIQEAKTDKYVVQEHRYQGDYDGYELRWLNCWRCYKKVFNFFGIKIPYKRYPQAKFDKREDAANFMEKLIHRDLNMKRDKVIMESI